MNVTSKGRYALRVMLDLARHREDGYISLKTIAERTDCSMKYLEMIVSHLKKAKLVGKIIMILVGLAALPVVLYGIGAAA